MKLKNTIQRKLDEKNADKQKFIVKLLKRLDDENINDEYDRTTQMSQAEEELKAIERENLEFFHAWECITIKDPLRTFDFVIKSY